MLEKIQLQKSNSFPLLRRYFLLVFFLSGSLTMLFMSLHYFDATPSGIVKGKAVATQTWYILVLRIHITAGILAMLIAPFQMLPIKRFKNRAWHAFLGKIYVMAVLISASCGLIIAQFAMGGAWVKWGFSCLALLWFSSTLKGISEIRKGHLQNHILFMYVSFACTFSTIPQRTLLLSTLVFGWEFITVYQFSAWVSWIMNCSIAIYFFQKKVREDTLS